MTDHQRASVRRSLAPLARQELARQRVGDFAALTVPGYKRARHAALLCDHLERLERREIPRLLVTMPPQHGKSLHTAQLFVAWYLGRHPGHRVIVSSYGSELAEENSRGARALLSHEHYPFPVSIAADSSAVGRWHVDGGGGVLAAGVGAGITGWGADLLVIDDPVRDRADADSAAIRESVWRWFAEVAMTRLRPGAIVLLCQTRWHHDDLAGRVLAGPTGDQWTTLSLPAVAEENDPLGRNEGELLWPEHFGAEHYMAEREILGGRGWSALFQQAPTPERGGTFQRHWLEGRYPRLPEKGLTIVQAVDSAFKTGVANDYSVIATWATDGAWFYLVDVWRRKVEYPELVRAIESEAAEHSPLAVLIEDKASGQSALQTLRASTGLPIIAAKAEGTKVSRAEAVSPLFEAGKVLLPEQAPSWLGDWVEEHVGFPASKHDDQVDTTSMALERLRAGRDVGMSMSGVVEMGRHGWEEVGEVVSSDPRGFDADAEENTRRANEAHIAAIRRRNRLNHLRRQEERDAKREGREPRETPDDSPVAEPC